VSCDNAKVTRVVGVERTVVFDDVIGLSPGDAARWTALVEECRPILENDGMEAVQTYLAECEVPPMIKAIAITRALLGQAQTPLRVAIDIVASSSARPIGFRAQVPPLR
jgi:hypothetical protein